MESYYYEMAVGKEEPLLEAQILLKCHCHWVTGFQRDNILFDCLKSIGHGKM